MNTGDGPEGEGLLYRLLAHRNRYPRRVKSREEERERLVERADGTPGAARSFGFLLIATAVYIAVGGGTASLFGATGWGLADYMLDGEARTFGDRVLVLAGFAIALWMCCLCGYATMREIRRDWARFDPPAWWPIRSRLG